VQHWLKPIGHAHGKLPADWFETRPGVLRRTGFPRRPRVSEGDRFVYGGFTRSSQHRFVRARIGARDLVVDDLCV
jgi:hypothetical protein